MPISLFSLSWSWRRGRRSKRWGHDLCPRRVITALKINTTSMQHPLIWSATFMVQNSWEVTGQTFRLQLEWSLQVFKFASCPSSSSSRWEIESSSVVYQSFPIPFLLSLYASYSISQIALSASSFIFPLMLLWCFLRADFNSGCQQAEPFRRSVEFPNCWRLQQLNHDHFKWVMLNQV